MQKLRGKQNGEKFKEAEDWVGGGGKRNVSPLPGKEGAQKN